MAPVLAKGCASWVMRSVLTVAEVASVSGAPRMITRRAPRGVRCVRWHFNPRHVGGGTDSRAYSRNQSGMRSVIRVVSLKS